MPAGTENQISRQGLAKEESRKYTNTNLALATSNEKSKWETNVKRKTRTQDLHQHEITISPKTYAFISPTIYIKLFNVPTNNNPYTCNF
ncbi:hypothetical protein HYC85_012489 [Camellia sinensis]|uniref:Uncharacterized protein n=1 Tax=Camellia sinensis TaxID=4442 RepID=A0A7J7HF97_CAMSI|nr:hypothetical protein HYC85_012489 [Camellia sinensis]